MDVTKLLLLMTHPMMIFDFIIIFLDGKSTLGSGGNSIRGIFKVKKELVFISGEGGQKNLSYGHSLIDANKSYQIERIIT